MEEECSHALWTRPAWGARAVCGHRAVTPRLHMRTCSLPICGGPLALTTTAQELRTCFAASGPVETVRMMTARDTGRPRGWGVVAMPNGAEAEAAMAGLPGTA
jgi:hypothetical protein